jgi:hypothetical protein
MWRERAARLGLSRTYPRCWHRPRTRSLEFHASEVAEAAIKTRGNLLLTERNQGHDSARQPGRRPRTAL